MTDPIGTTKGGYYMGDHCYPKRMEIHPDGSIRHAPENTATDPIGTAQELIDSLRARSKDNWRDELGGSTCELIEEAADALGRLTETLEFVRDWLADSRDVGADGWVPLDHINAALSLHRRPT